MDGALVLITLVSLGTTGAVLLYAARLIRDERARSDARVAALAEEIAHAAGPGHEPARAPLARRATAAPPMGAVPPGGSPLVERPSAHVGTRPVRPRVATDALGDPPLVQGGGAGEAADPAGRSGGMLFETGAASDSTSARWLVPAIGGVIVLLALTTVYLVSGPASDAGAQAARPVSSAAQAPLELVSLRHVRDGAALTVSGVVRNPAGAPERSEVSAVVFLFGRDGSFVASGRAPVDYQALAPGDESPFTIGVPDAEDVSRYRVSFRAGDDVLPHVDRREAAVRADQAAARP